MHAVDENAYGCGTPEQQVMMIMIMMMVAVAVAKMTGLLLLLLLEILLALHLLSSAHLVFMIARQAPAARSHNSAAAAASPVLCPTIIAALVTIKLLADNAISALASSTTASPLALSLIAAVSVMMTRACTTTTRLRLWGLGPVVCWQHVK